MNISLSLTSEERQILKSLLETDLTDLRSQIIHADSWEFKNMLKNWKGTVVKVLNALEDQPDLAN